MVSNRMWVTQTRLILYYDKTASAVDSSKSHMAGPPETPLVSEVIDTKWRQRDWRPQSPLK